MVEPEMNGGNWCRGEKKSGCERYDLLKDTTRAKKAGGGRGGKEAAAGQEPSSLSVATAVAEEARPLRE